MGGEHCDGKNILGLTAYIILTIFYMDHSCIENCPVLRPSLKEFDNFRQYMQRLDQQFKKDYGMVKIVPPKGWTAHVKDYRKKLEELVVNGPIEQNTFGKGGIYQCLHIPRKSMSFSQFRQKSQDLDKITDNLSTKQIEEMFWKNVTFSAPLYGADLLNSLMDSSSKGWNLNTLDSLLQDSLTNKVKGINTPYCYLGSWKAFFCWHTEDLDLSGVNFIHQGKSKFWYAISHQDKKIIQMQAEKLFPEHFASCKQFLRHKTILINPYYLKKKYTNLRISKIEHKEHEIIAVFGGSYHCGFNFGFNVAEAINYATKDWLRQIIEVKSCKCLKSSVKASEYEIYKNLAANANINTTKQFLAFQEYIFKKAEAQDSQQELQQAKMGVSKQFSKKIKKQKKPPTKITFKNEEYDIQNWAQCQKCKLWRVVKKVVRQNEYFQCKNAQKQCYRRQKIDKKVFTITS